jgi:7-cyano-7-deazaguanine reductase
MSTPSFKTLGERVTKFAGFETFPSGKNLDYVTLKVQDVASICPVTGQPDFSSVEIEYSPTASVLETKTVKLYLETFRDQGIFVEDLAQKIAEDVSGAISPYSVRVTVNQRVRGGIETTAQASIIKRGAE